MKKKIVAAIVMSVLCFVTLCVKTYYVATDPELAEKQDKQMYYTTVVSGKRGIIYDCKGRPLDLMGYQTFLLIKPNAIDKSDENTMSTITEAAAYPSELAKAMGDDVPAVIKLKGEIPYVKGAITVKTITKLSQSGFLCHVLGYADRQGINGIFGLEKGYDEVLSGFVPDTVKFLVDARRQGIPGAQTQFFPAAQPLAGIKTTIDRDIQEIAENAADKYIEKGAIVIMETNSGHIKAMVSRPYFDTQNIQDFIDSSNNELINRAVTEYNLGSIFKICVMAAALEKGIPTSFEYTCTGSTQVNGLTFGCSNKNGDGKIDMKRALANSCNTYFINLALTVGLPDIISMAKSMGLSSESVLAEGIVSKKGNLPDDTYPSAALCANTAIGQGDIMVTPVQAVGILNTVASGGIYYEPGLAYSQLSENLIQTGSYYKENSRRVMSEKTADTIMETLRLVVSDGTGKNARVDIIGGSGGKTATSETGWLVDGELMTHGWFAGFYPANKPEYTICVLNEGGESGGKSAAPTFKDICENIGKLWGY